MVLTLLCDALSKNKTCEHHKSFENQFLLKCGNQLTLHNQKGTHYNLSTNFEQYHTLTLENNHSDLPLSLSRQAWAAGTIQTVSPVLF